MTNLFFAGNNRTVELVIIIIIIIIDFRGICFLVENACMNFCSLFLKKIFLWISIATVIKRAGCPVPDYIIGFEKIQWQVMLLYYVIVMCFSSIPRFCSFYLFILYIKSLSTLFFIHYCGLEIKHVQHVQILKMLYGHYCCHQMSQ